MLLHDQAVEHGDPAMNRAPSTIVSESARGIPSGGFRSGIHQRDTPRAPQQRTLPDPGPGPSGAEARPEQFTGRHLGGQEASGGLTCYSARRRDISRAAAANMSKTLSTARLMTPSGSVQLPMSSV
jgi:hypothetical protein